MEELSLQFISFLCGASLVFSVGYWAEYRYKLAMLHGAIFIISGFAWAIFFINGLPWAL